MRTRRQFIADGSLALGAAGLIGCSKKSERTEIRIGIIALTDCSPIVVAHELGFFRKYGIDAAVIKGASWAAIRDGLTTGDLQATQMLLGMPLAASLGLLGAPKVPLIAPWILNRNGQAITLKTELSGMVGADASALRPHAEEAKAKGDPLKFAATFPAGTHAMWLRYYLGSGGIHPDKDISLITIPPPQMVANMKVKKMDGFCVGEPWNTRAIAEGVGFTAVTTQKLWPDHPEKVCAFRADFAARNPKIVIGVLKALAEASLWLDDAKNRPEQAEIVSRAAYINCDKDTIARDRIPMIFEARGCNYPQPKYAKWFLSQFRRWGMLEPGVDYEKVALEVMRPDLYETAMAELGRPHRGRDDSPETLFDGRTFDPADPEKYASSFDVHALRA